MRKLTLVIGLLLLVASPSFAQQSQKGEDVNSIPYPLEKWKGTQGKVLAESKPYFVGRKKAPEGAPNVLVIMLDDAGYSNAGSYGGAMRTPTFDRLGDEGVRRRLFSDARVAADRA
jgi:arylsulfatase